MKRSIQLIAAILLVFLCLPGMAQATLDQYLGDSAIYSGSSEYLRPNVIFLIDNSAGMAQAGSRDPYDPDTTYSGSYDTWTVYNRTAATGGTINYVSYITNSGSDAADLLENVTCATADEALLANAYYAGPLKKNDGSCNASQAGNYFLGNILNYIESAAVTAAAWSLGTSYAVGDTVSPTTPVYDANGTALEYECVTAGISDASEPSWPTEVGASVTDGTVVWELSGSIIDLVKATLSQVIDGSRESVKIGVMVFGDNNAGGKVLAPVAELAVGDTDGGTNYTTLTSAIDGITLLNANSQPVNELFYDVAYYFKGENSSSGKISSDNVPYLSPLDYSCQKNFVILLTTGATDTNNPKTRAIGDLNGDGNEGYVDDLAKDNYESDLDDSTTDVENIQTHVIQLLTPKVDRLEDATNGSHGRGSYFHVNNANELTQALLDAMANIVLESDTSFVAPVVPTSPENRTYSGERVYLGFFKPITQKPWLGNLKKFGLDSQTNILDKNGNIATLSNGSFTDSSVSYWSTSADAAHVDQGGAGELLRDRTLSTRLIYSNLSSELDLTHADNRFNDTNVSYTDLGVADATENTALINYIYGYDSYDDDGDGNTTENRDWVLGDILHSKPQIVNYNTYTFTTANEANCSTNKTMVYVGTNDGMLHAFNDCDGTEAWAFIPDNLLPNLSALAERPATHSYYVDASPVSYVYDKDSDGNIGLSEAADGDSDDGSADKVILIVGERRGGGAYYALDITDPATPKYLWKIDNSTSGFGELGQTWSEPNFGKIKYDDGSGNIDKIVAFVGAGYDSDNEDGRFGNTQGFTDADVASTTTIGDGLVTSTANVTPARDASSYGMTNNPIGRGVYAFEIATLDSSGVPTIPTSPVKVWDFTYSTSGTNAYNTGRLIYPIPSDVTVLDTDYDGYIDRLYVGDTGGQMWRISEHQTSGGLRPVANAVINDWVGKRIFEANAASTNSTDKGRTFFYRPSVTFETGGVVNIYIGSGDRAHPLNTAVTDRIYAIYDRGQRTNEEIDEDNLVDVTTDILQVATTSAADITTQITALAATSNYGWYIKLDRLNDSNLHAGEKILASALAFNKVAYYTSYTPNSSFSTDPCSPGNLGLSRLYGVDYKTGEAVLNFSNSNDSESTVDNTRALSKDGKVLRRADREVTLGVGIPSGLVVVMPASGDAKLLIGCGGGLCSEDPVTGGTIIPIYWMNW